MTCNLRKVPRLFERSDNWTQVRVRRADVFLSRTSLPGNVRLASHFAKESNKSKGEASIEPNALLQQLQARGLLQDLTSRAVHQHLSSAKRTIYLGVDPSASSLHVGNLLPLLALVHFTLAGHSALLLVGGATGSIGDPSGRSKERNALDPETLNDNIKSIETQVNNILHNVQGYLERRRVSYSRDTKPTTLERASVASADMPSARLRIEVINNAEWYQGVGVLRFLTDVGRYARMSDMLARESVASRLGARNSSDDQSSEPIGMSFTEFSYQLLQAYDFSVLHDGPYQCTLQLGGSDQLGNIMAGVQLILRKHNSTQPSRSEQKDDILPAYGITVPLLTTSNGAKFGKSAGNAIWLDPKLLSDYDLYQYFWRSTDADVHKFLNALTLLPLEEVERIMQRHRQDPSKRIAQEALALEILELVRGPKAVQRARDAQKVLFGSGLESLKVQDIKAAFDNDPKMVRLTREAFEGVDILAICVTAQATKSRGEARRLVHNGGVYLNNVAVKDTAFKLSQDSLLKGVFCVLRIGKSDHRILVVE
ncbi:tyrosyl-tRNA synthetase [Tilletiaria anomala UBC 951]|uniref:tyrosine--tRNA ligase n=1 Tax=Tilletiaria anomala (strain ATCC 24038 / CBS 436.72 / UBC 951) TaxID=1037660 RepID=A0A066VIP8_TILAU|nr:tyrosyl-tRNA synthetase [Tilletiaria anomala UBC 951]KDN38450.1 tyrosyl-tRNA synthetase [Tilletiaria anomala UBC 951]